MALRLITAGESHGPGLTCIVEGLPAGLELDRDAINARHGAPPARPRPRRAHEDRARRRGGHRRRPPRPHARRPDRAPGRQPRLRQLGGADEPVAGRGRGARGAPPAPRPRRPRRDRGSTASPTCATCSSAPARARPRRAWRAARCAKAFLRALGVEVLSHVIADRLRPRPRARRTADPRGLRRRRRRPRCAAWTPTRRARWSRRSTCCARRNESLGGVFEVRRLRARARPRLARVLGGAPRRPHRRCAMLLDPGGQGRRPSATASTLAGAPGLRRPTTRSSSTRSAATTARPTAPAASRAA